MKSTIRASITTSAALLTLALLGKTAVQAQTLPEIKLPDLYISTTTSAQNEGTGQWYVSILVGNRGKAASGACTLQFFQHTGVFSTIFGHTAEACINRNAAVPGLNPGQTAWVTINVGTSNPVGQWGECRVDCYNTIFEGSENNNTKNHYF